MLAWILLVGPASALDLTLDGTCGGAVTFTLTGATKSGLVAVLTADEAGERPVPHGPCASALTGLGRGMELRQTATASETGTWTASPTLGPKSCGMRVQVIDVATCSASPVVLVGKGVDADADGFDIVVDCDDADRHVYPGAPPLCDGVRNDCLTDWTSDRGLVSWFDDDGSVTDLTPIFTIGTPLQPQRFDLARDVEGSRRGRLAICPGVYHVRMP